MTQNTAHLEHWTLDELAEGTLSEMERTRAEAHLRQCTLCTAELQASRAVIEALSALPQFAPSATFADAVMARVVMPAAAPEAVKKRRWLPQTRRGWMLVLAAGVAPLAPVVPFLAWVFSHPGVTLGSIWSIGSGWVMESVWGATVRGVEWALRSGMAQWVVEQGGRLPGGYASLLAIAVMALLAIPVSGWAMVRLLRAPTGELAHAH